MPASMIQAASENLVMSLSDGFMQSLTFEWPMHVFDRRKGRRTNLSSLPRANVHRLHVHDDQLQWELSIIILPLMPYVFVYEDWFVGAISVLILSLLVLRYLMARKRD